VHVAAGQVGAAKREQLLVPDELGRPHDRVPGGAQQVIEARELDLITVAGKTEPVRICGSGPFPADGSNSRGMITHSALRQTEIR